eukprot:SM000029S10426  [mRNA]  locus=s29:27678:30266:+ [translate_table: standard]
MAPPPARLLLALLSAALLAAAAAAQSLAGCPWHMLPAQAYLDPAAAPLRQLPWLPQACSHCLLWAWGGLQPQFPQLLSVDRAPLPPWRCAPPPCPGRRAGGQVFAGGVRVRAGEQPGGLHGAPAPPRRPPQPHPHRRQVHARPPSLAVPAFPAASSLSITASFAGWRTATLTHPPIIACRRFAQADTTRPGRHDHPRGHLLYGTELGGSRKDLRWPARFSRLGYSRTSFVPVSMEQFKAVVGVSQARLLTLGDLFGSTLTDTALYAHPFGPIRRTCKLPLRPHPAIIAAAEGFVNTFLGDRFLAVHLRRNDFWYVQRLCAQPEICYWPIPEVAGFIQEKAKSINTTVVLLATDAHPLEGDVLGQALQMIAGEACGSSVMQTELVNGSLHTLQHFSSFAANGSSSHKLSWLDDAWKKAGFEDGSIAGFARMALEKVICSMSAAFLGTAKSTFSLHIIRMRLALGHHSCKDRQLGEGWDDTQPRLVSQ